MSIKSILAFALLLLLAYTGVYIVIYGFERYELYSGAERDFNLMSASELQPKLNLKGNIETVTYMLCTEVVTSDILGIPVGSATRYYYVLPIGYEEDFKNQKYCLIAVSDTKDAEALDKLKKSVPVPLDPNAPRFEFRGMSLDMPEDIYHKFQNYLYEEYDTDFNIYMHANVSKNLVPYIIFVKGKNDENFLLPIIVGAVCAVVGAGLFILLAIRIYRKKHMYG